MGSLINNYYFSLLTLQIQWSYPDCWCKDIIVKALYIIWLYKIKLGCDLNYHINSIVIWKSKSISWIIINGLILILSDYKIIFILVWSLIWSLVVCLITFLNTSILRSYVNFKTKQYECSNLYYDYKLIVH